MFDLVPFKSTGNITKRGDAFDRLFTKMFEQPFSIMNHLDTTFHSFKVDVKETDAAYELTADLPGVKKEAISLDYKQNYLTITARGDEEAEDKKDNYIYRERHTGSIQRSFYIDNVEADGITAKFQDGLLHVTLPKQISQPERSGSIRID